MAPYQWVQCPLTALTCACGNTSHCLLSSTDSCCAWSPRSLQDRIEIGSHGFIQSSYKGRGMIGDQTIFGSNCSPQNMIIWLSLEKGAGIVHKKY